MAVWRKRGPIARRTPADWRPSQLRTIRANDMSHDELRTFVRRQVGAPDVFAGDPHHDQGGEHGGGIVGEGGLDAVAVNAGVSGDTTANGLARFDWSVAAAEPDLLVVALGANDFLMGVPPDIARANLAAILKRARAAGIPAVLVGLTPRGAMEPGSREAAYAAIYPELAAEYDVPYYPSLLGHIEGDPSLLQPDGLHRTKQGVVVISAPLAAFLEPVIQSIEAQ